MANIKKPVVPKIPNFAGRLFRKLFGKWYDDNDAIFMFGQEEYPYTCIYTATS
jgi:hypothetical protein